MSRKIISPEKIQGNTTFGSCSFCGDSFEVKKSGRPRKYCKASCRQRAYQSRKWGIGEVWDHLQASYCQCYICGEPLDWESPQTLCLDHVIATVYGGRTNVENLRPVHLKCNALKGMKLIIPALDPYARRDESGDENRST